ncbi:MAG: Xaa-Pro dipeptidase [Gammaproteobacteria bacterium]|nr:Xaa-Pro dipeptidase [Gammaproteobacteria bacterium]
MTPAPFDRSENLEQQLTDHIEEIKARWELGLQHSGHDGVWIAAGDSAHYFQDDQGPRFKPNPYFTQWVDPKFATPGAQLLLRDNHQPILFLHQPSDYWHATTPIPQNLNPQVDIRTFSNEDKLAAACADETSGKLAFIGNSPNSNETLGELNPTKLLQYMHFHRARKTQHELENLRKASEIGVQGHLAAAAAFTAGASEYETHIAYLLASKQSEAELPYPNIVAQNEHGSVLHYQLQQRDPANELRSLLIDAGGSFAGYASDITRTYVSAGSQHQLFRDLLEAMQTHQDQLLNSIAPGTTYADLHTQMHQQLCALLVSADLVTCTAEEAFDTGVSEIFCPHGLGHLLGIQVHDVGGHQADELGNVALPPANYPALRLTRKVEENYTFTIEPGLYFIQSLLESHQHAPINWKLVAKLSPYGGIRIEDNVRVLAHGIENMTRDAWRKYDPT